MTACRSCRNLTVSRRVHIVVMMESLLLSVMFATAAQAGRGGVAPPILQIDTGGSLGRVSPLHSGLMTEEINHSFDGGIYGELISNRAFAEPIGLPGSLPPHWSLMVGGAGAGVMALDDADALSAVLPESLRLSVISAPSDSRVGIANDGFWGVPIRPRTRYRGSFYARVESGSIDVLTLSLESLPSHVVYARAEVRLVPGGWRHYEVDLTTPADISPTTKAEFVMSATQRGAVWLNLISLFQPTWGDRANGNRIDLMQKLQSLHPSFLRFPGGDYLLGDTIATRFDWKKTVGPLTERPTHFSTWGYQSSDGMGLLEFLEWCEDLHMEPVLAVYAGLSHWNPVIQAGPNLQPFVKDALDEIEYVTGSVDTPWGAQRAKDGHPAPYKLTYVEIGNEDNLYDKSDYENRFAQFYDAIREKYPTLQIIATGKVKSRKPDVVDEHYYRKAQEFFDDIRHYDLYPRNGPKIFVGEWATTEGELTPNMHAALGDAAWMTGMERNSDLVVMQAYAPLLVNVNKGASKASPNLIGYDGLRSYGSPSYYAQMMFNKYRGDEILSASPSVSPDLFTSVTRDSRTGTVYVKAVNISAESQDVRIGIIRAKRIESEGKAVVLTGRPDDTNSIQDPTKIVPVEHVLHNVAKDFEYSFPGHSVTVLEVHLH